MDSKTLEKLFVVLDDALNSGRVTEEDMTSAMLALSTDLPVVESEVRDHVVLLHVQGELTNVYGPMTTESADQFILRALENWGSDRGSCLLEKWLLTTPAVGNCRSEVL